MDPTLKGGSGISYLANGYRAPGQGMPVFQSIASMTPLTDTLAMGRINDGPSNTVFFAEGYASCSSPKLVISSAKSETFLTWWETNYNPNPRWSSLTDFKITYSKTLSAGRGALAPALANDTSLTATPNYPNGWRGAFSSAYAQQFSASKFHGSGHWTYHSAIIHHYPPEFQGDQPQSKAMMEKNGCDPLAPQAIWNGQFQVAMGDGSVRSVNQAISLRSWLAVLTPNGQDAPGADW